MLPLRTPGTLHGALSSAGFSTVDAHMEKDGGFVATRTEGFENLDPRSPRQHPIEHHQIERLGVQEEEALLPGVRRGRGEPAALQSRYERAGSLLVVLDNE